MPMLKRHWFALAAGAICFAWAFAGWLTVIPNQDILADGIQVQSLLHHPHLVLSFPGQKHAGPIEYPVQLLAEMVAPGNYYVHTLFRTFLAFLTGFLAAKLYLTLFPAARRWSFLAAIAVGPSIIHGLLGPSSNPVGVWWLQPYWDMAWLFVTAGAYVVARQLNRIEVSVRVPRKSMSLVAVGGLLVGLGFFAHPAITILIFPLLVLVVLRLRVSVQMTVVCIAGAIFGVFPSVISYVVNSGSINTWDPSHGPMINVPLYGAALGINGNPDYMLALLPFAVGLSPSGTLIPPVAQSLLMWGFLVLLVAVTAIGVNGAWRNRTRPTPATAIAISWLAAAVAIIGFSTLIDPVWIYATGLSVLFWISVGVLPSAFAHRWVGIALTACVLLIVAGSTVTHNWTFYSQFTTRMQAKQDYMNTNDAVAEALVAGGAAFVYGSYYDAIPIGYASAYKLRTITNHYNRFPLTSEEENKGEVTVAVNSAPTDPWGDEALQTVLASCEPDSKSKSESAGVAGYQIFTCPTSLLMGQK